MVITRNIFPKRFILLGDFYLKSIPRRSVCAMESDQAIPP